MEREISLLRDLVSLVRIYRVSRRLRPAIVKAGTPKTVLLGMIAVRAAGVPVRIYSLHGLRWETAGGLKRFVLGVPELLDAFDQVLASFPDARLLILGVLRTATRSLRAR